MGKVVAENSNWIVEALAAIRSFASALPKLSSPMDRIYVSIGSFSSYFIISERKRLVDFLPKLRAGVNL